MSRHGSLKERQLPGTQNSHPGQVRATARKKENRRLRSGVPLATKLAAWAEASSIRTEAAEKQRRAIAAAMARRR